MTTASIYDRLGISRDTLTPNNAEAMVMPELIMPEGHMVVATPKASLAPGEVMDKPAGRWTPVGQLSAGMSLLSRDSKAVKIKSVALACAPLVVQRIHCVAANGSHLSNIDEAITTSLPILVPGPFGHIINLIHTPPKIVMAKDLQPGMRLFGLIQTTPTDNRTGATDLTVWPYSIVAVATVVPQQSYRWFSLVMEKPVFLWTSPCLIAAPDEKGSLPSI